MLAILPLLFAVASISFFVVFKSDDLIDDQLVRIETHLISSKTDELKNYTALALKAVEHVYQMADGNEEEAKERVKNILSELQYGGDGYFFVYDDEGTGLVHPTQPEIVGLNWWGLQDTHGRLIIKELTDRAKNGGGFYRYLWEKPSSGQQAEKISYAVMLDKWNWMIGTGIYLDDINRQIETRKIEIKKKMQDLVYIIVSISIFSLLLVFMTGIVINMNERKLADNKLKELTHHIVTVQEDERARVSRELHDGISQLLVSVKYSLELAREKALSDRDQSRRVLEKGIGGIQEVIREVRRISRDLRPSVLDDLGLGAALESMAEEFGERTAMEVTYVPHKFTRFLTKDIKTTLFRVAQEALTNIERHANASEVSIVMQRKVDGVRMTVSDNGQGFNVLKIDRKKQYYEGIGLRNMQERLEFHGGSLTIWSAPGEGTIVEAKLPNSILTQPDP